jgi:regulator of protease activity HflC (stomatin/prohibitin superfamily)
MFDRLWEVLAQIWHDLLPWVVIEPYQNAGRFRLGVYRDTLKCDNGAFGTGLHFKIPFADNVNPQNVSVTTTRLPPQTLETRDGVGVVVAVQLRFRIEDVKPYLCGVTDQLDVLIDTAMGGVLRAVMTRTYEEIRASLAAVSGAQRMAEVEKTVAERTRNLVREWGFVVEQVTFTDFGKVRSYRLIAPHAANLFN